ncbi:MAG: DUF4258 domain-containing protein [Peptococcaceae bacterium]|nr:DUF4258 domain-containing protein [Peptococcaceae bacterium]
MEVWFSRHARNRMRFWHLTDDVVFQTLAEPDQVLPSKNNRKNFWKALNGGLLRVTCIEEDDRTVIITVTLRKKKGE